MRVAYRKFGWLAWQLLVWLFRAPIAFAITLVRLWAARSLLGSAITRRTCGADISCLGLWECGKCGYSWHGWYFSRCEACGDVPPYIECHRCGASTTNPLIFGPTR